MHLTAPPSSAQTPPLTPGVSQIELTNGRSGRLFVPGGPVRGLVVALHGAGGHAQAALDMLQPDAERLGLVVLAPASAGSTWSILRRGVDVDTAALDAALQDVFRAQPFPAAAVAVAGFSDGASYALTLGLANGELFAKVVAFSPGFEIADRRQGRPKFCITHGTGDAVLPIERTSRRLVRQLREEGYDLSYREFDGGHVVPPHYLAAAAAWIVDGSE